MIISPVTCSIDDYDDILFAAIPTDKEFLARLEHQQEYVMQMPKSMDCESVELGSPGVLWFGNRPASPLTRPVGAATPEGGLEDLEKLEDWESVVENDEWIMVPEDFVIPEGLIKQVDCPRVTIYRDGGFCFKAYDPEHCKFALETWSFSASDVVKFRKESIDG